MSIHALKSYTYEEKGYGRTNVKLWGNLQCINHFNEKDQESLRNGVRAIPVNINDISQGINLKRVRIGG